jgi:molybdate transport system regulatory protein
MPSKQARWAVDVRLWFKLDGEKVLGPGRVQLLERIDELHSISAAAKRMGMSYRRAWLLVQSMNAGSDAPLVERVTGGAGGGGATLTDAGRDALRRYRELLQQLHAVVERFPLGGKKPTR